jgi:hypothetical protein
MTKAENVHALKFREAKAPQGNPSASVLHLFKLEGRTIVIAHI